MPSLSTCGTCRHWRALKDAPAYVAGTCAYPVPAWLVRAMALDVQYTYASEGNDCTAYAALQQPEDVAPQQVVGLVNHIHLQPSEQPTVAVANHLHSQPLRQPTIGAPKHVPSPPSFKMALHTSRVEGSQGYPRPSPSQFKWTVGGMHARLHPPTTPGEQWECPKCRHRISDIAHELARPTLLCEVCGDCPVVAFIAAR